MDCGSLLPLFRGSPAAAKVSKAPKNTLRCRQRGSASTKHRLGPFDGQQAGLLKAAAGCRSPWSFARFQSVLLRWERKITRQPMVALAEARGFFVAVEELFHIRYLPEGLMFG